MFLLVLAGWLGGCRAPRVSPVVPAPVEGEQASVEAVEEPAEPPRPIIIRDTDEPLLPENLRGRVGFRNYSLEQEDERTIVAVTVVNLMVEEPVPLEMAARFDDAEGEPVVLTQWTRVDLQPMGRHQFLSETSDLRAVEGTILVRLLTEELDQ